MTDTTSSSTSRFVNRAKELHHDLGVIERDGIHETHVQCHSIEQIRAVLGPRDDKEAKMFVESSEQAIDNQKKAGTRHDSHTMTRHAMEQFVFGNRNLSAQQRETVESALPLTIRATSIPTKTLARDEVWDLGTSSNPVVLNIGTLTMEPGSAIKIANTYLELSCDKLIRNSDIPPA